MPEGVCGRNGCKWTIAEADIFCGLCGRRVASVEIMPTEICVYQDSAEAKEPFYIYLANNGLNRVHIEQVRVDLGTKVQAADVLHWDPEESPDQTREGKILLHGERVRIRLDLPPEVLTKHGGGGGFVLFETSAGDARTDVAVLPPFEVDVPEEEVLIVGGGDHVLAVPVTCICGRGWIEDVSVESSWARVDWAGRELELTRERPLIAEVAVRGKELAGGTGDTALQVNIRARWRRAPFKYVIPVAYADPPELTVLGAKTRRVEILEGEDKGVVEWQISNGGQLPLELRSVVVECQPSMEVRLLSPILDVGDVQVLEAGTGTAMRVEVSGTRLSVGSYDASVCITWRGLGKPASGAIQVRNPEGVDAVFLDQREVLRLKISVQQIETEGEAAIDFGTTSSCCAVWDSRAAKHELVPLEPDRSEPKVMRTAVVYQEALGEEGIRPWVFGYQAVSYATIPAYADAAVLSIKRKIGNEKEQRITVSGKDYGRRPRMVVADIFADLRRRIVYSARRQPQRVILTAPAMFSKFERDALCEAAVAAGFPSGKANLTLIEEPIAAAASFFIELENQRRHKLEPVYTLLVCDIGGGTTDVCLLRITDKQDAGRRRLVVETLAMGGNPRFGGNDITERLAEKLLRQCVERDEKYRDLPYSRKGIPATGSILHEQAARHNRGELERIAEVTKIDLGKKKKTGDLSKSLTLRFPGKPPETAPRDLVLTREDIEDAVQADLDVICKMIHGLLDWADDRYDLGLRNGCPDLLMLAGRSCNIPSLQEHLKSHFGKNACVFDPKMCKECVVAGALELYHRQTHPSATFSLEMVRKDNCSAVAVGIDVPCDDRLGMRFEPIIPQFGELDNWHGLTFDYPGPTVEYNVYESYSPGYSEALEDSPFTRVIGRFSKDIPAEALRLCADGHPFRIEMKLDSAGRQLGVRASIGDKWCDHVILDRAASDR